MQTRTEAGAAPTALSGATWLAAGLAAGASLLRWLGTDTDTHSWSSDALVSLVAGAGLMALAVALVAWRWGARTARSAYLIGAAGTATVVMAFLIPLALGQPPSTGHEGHGVQDGDGIAMVEWIRTLAELSLVGVLLWLYRRSEGRGPASH